MPPPQSEKRLWLVMAFAFVLCSLVVGDLFKIQVLSHERYLAEAERQHRQRLDLPARRGHIFDRTGEPLARECGFVSRRGHAIDDKDWRETVLLVNVR